MYFLLMHLNNKKIHLKQESLFFKYFNLYFEISNLKNCEINTSHWDVPVINIYLICLNSFLILASG